MNHVEAYHLMQYQDAVTGEIEIIWNSRDGVTPFSITSKNGNEAKHINWQQDVFDPFYIPKSGDRIFVDATPQLVRSDACNYVAKYWDATGDLCMKDHPFFKKMNMFQAIEHFIKEWTNKGQPWITTVK